MSCRYKENTVGGSSTAECGNNWTSKLSLFSFMYFSGLLLIEFKQTHHLSDIQSRRWNFQAVWTRHSYFLISGLFRKLLVEMYLKCQKEKSVSTVTGMFGGLKQTRNIIIHSVQKKKKKRSLKGIKLISNWKIII